MSNVARKRNALWLALAVLWVVLLFRLVACDPISGGTDAGKGTGGARPGASRSFTIEGEAAAPISPGIRAPLDLELTNPNDVAMSVTDLRVTVRAVSAPNADDSHPCAVGDFAIDQARSRLEVTLTTRSTSTLSNLGIPRATLPQVGMLNRPVNQDGCKGASLTLGYTASGTLEN
jgi:hypothetical protein